VKAAIGRLTADSSVREVLALSTPKRAKKAESKKQRSVTVTLEFSDNYQKAAALLSKIIPEEEVVSVFSDKAFKSALAQELGKDVFLKIADKVKQS